MFIGWLIKKFLHQLQKKKEKESFLRLIRLPISLSVKIERMENWRERKNSSAFLSQRLTTTLIARIQKTLRSLFAHSIFELVIIVGRPSNGNDNLILQLGKEKKYHIISAARNDGRSLIRMTALFAPLSWHEALSNRRLPTRSTRFIPANTWWRSRHTDAILESAQLVFFNKSVT